MEVLITGCERSGTKMLSKKIGESICKEILLENKHTIASFKYYEELQKWVKYENDKVPLNNIGRYEKHTLNDEININFLKWVKFTFPNVKIYYIIRDGRNVVSSIINKEWGYSQNRDNYKIGIEEACKQWNIVISNTWEWAKENCEIVRYEDICDIISNPLNESENEIVTPLLKENLEKTGYKL